jgi:hypothetical protein
MTLDESNLPLSARIIKKDGWFWSLLNCLILVVTCGGNRRFLTGYITTIGPWIAVPSSWWQTSVVQRQKILRHELVHVRQFRACGLGSAVFGIPLMFLLYLLPLPIGLAYGRYRIERAGYLEGIRKLVEDNASSGRITLEIDAAVSELTGSHYGWTWPFSSSVRRWFDEQTTKIIVNLEV